MKTPKIICKKKNVHTTATIIKQTEDGIYLRCDACDYEWSDEIGRWAHLFE